jgi:hypothetical protein
MTSASAVGLKTTPYHNDRQRIIQPKTRSERFGNKNIPNYLEN